MDCLRRKVCFGEGGCVCEKDECVDNPNSWNLGALDEAQFRVNTITQGTNSAERHRGLLCRGFEIKVWLEEPRIQEMYRWERGNGREDNSLHG